MIWAIDVSDAAVSALVAEISPEGPRIVGTGGAPTQGLSHGEFTHLGDVAESLATAIRQAEHGSGRRCQEVFYNFDDPAMENRFVTGSRTLPGEGQVRAEDVSLAADMARRMVTHFEWTAVYSREISFLIDGKDAVADPIGVFGRQLDVEVHLLLSRAQHAENWRRAFERARIERSFAVPSLVSSAFGVLTGAQRQARRIIWDLGRDVLTGGVFERGGLRDFTVRSAQGLEEDALAEWVLAETKSLVKRNAGCEEAVITGELAERSGLAESLSEGSLKTRPASPSGFAGLEQPRDAAAAGLLRLAAETPRARSAGTQRQMITGLRRKAEELINEYF